jgi:uncharacterized sporulation protein YeaH/YhbH (DUF444 family)
LGRTGLARRTEQENARPEEKSGNLNHVAGKQIGRENKTNPYLHSQRLKREHDQLTNRISKTEFSIEDLNMNTIDLRRSPSSLPYLIYYI